MSILNVYFGDDSELAEYEASSKGYRIDVFVKINETVYNVNVYDLFRLQQDFDSDIQYYGFYAVDPNLILVKEVTKEEITKTIKKLFEQKYFEFIKPVEHIELSQLIKVY